MLPAQVKLEDSGKPFSCLYTPEILDQYDSNTISKIDKVLSAIDQAFGWAESPQGSEYWANVRSTLSDMSRRIVMHLDAKRGVDKPVPKRRQPAVPVMDFRDAEVRVLGHLGNPGDRFDRFAIPIRIGDDLHPDMREPV